VADPTGVGLGAGGTAIAAAIAYAADKIFGGKKVDEELKSIKEKYLLPVLKVAEDWDEFKKLFAVVVAQTSELHVWHNVVDPKDTTQKIWYFSVALRNLLESIEAHLEKQAAQTVEVARRLERLYDVMNKLVEALGRIQVE